jgi:hypothetical protein
MTEREDEFLTRLRDGLSQQFDGLTPLPLRQKAVDNFRLRRRLATIGLGTLTLVLVVAALSLGDRLLGTAFTDRQSTDIAAAASPSPTTPEESGERVVEILSGEVDDKDFSLLGYVAPPPPDQDSSITGDYLCVDFRIQGETEDFLCQNGWTRDLPPGEFEAVGMPRPAGSGFVFFGRASSEVSSVEARGEDGKVATGLVVTAPPALQVPDKFFLVKSGAAGGVTIVARDASGTVVSEKTLVPGTE